MTLTSIVERQKRIQSVLVEYTRGDITDTNARDKLRAMGMPHDTIDRLFRAVADNILRVKA
jgi:hypothetical protein